MQKPSTTSQKYTLEFQVWKLLFISLRKYTYTHITREGAWDVNEFKNWFQFRDSPGLPFRCLDLCTVPVSTKVAFQLFPVKSFTLFLLWLKVSIYWLSMVRGANSGKGESWLISQAPIVIRATFSSSHLLFSPSHLTFSSSHLIFPSHLLISPSHLLISPSHLLISSSHLPFSPYHLLSSPSLLLFFSSHLLTLTDNHMIIIREGCKKI